MTNTAAVVLVGLSVVVSTAATVGAQAPEDTGWMTYRNTEYGYEIRHPAEFEVRPTGPEGERDGRAIRIMRKDYAAPVPVLDVHARAPEPSLESTIEDELAEMDMVVGEVTIGGISAKEVTYRWKSNGEIAFVNLYVKDALIEFHANPGIRDLRETIWWKVISTLRFTEP